ncbi:MAG: UDP-N-acetylglucosamine 2-epimerase (non-hydrolyzing) [Rhizobacter sp.]|nr:UDP-N-acetylglucosamine 2-epimerase (non-hydrolyzing) [Burkholderiales bacterium]
MRVLTVLGTRPEAIKLAPVVMACKAEPSIDHCLCATGQHREMLDQVLKVFSLLPDYDLNLMRPDQNLGQLTADAIVGVQSTIRKFSPDWVVVQGDTTTAFAGALAAFYQRVPVVHIEAGLRTGNLLSPWPEELNRRLVTQIAQLHCAPTSWAANNLRNEGVAESDLVITGNTVIDALRWASGRPEADAALREHLGVCAAEVLSGSRRILLVTGHRRENLDGTLAAMCDTLKVLAERGDLEIVFPVHLNPDVQRTVNARLGNLARVHLLPPLDYLSFVALLHRSHLVITDSGGIQEEAPGLGKPVLVTRDTTERPEAVQAGTALLVGKNAEALLSATSHLLDNEDAYSKMSKAQNPFGNGNAAELTIEALLKRSQMITQGA